MALAGQLDRPDRLLAKKHKPLLARIFAPSLLGPLDFGEKVATLKARCKLDDVRWPSENSRFPRPNR